MPTKTLEQQLAKGDDEMTKRINTLIREVWAEALKFAAENAGKHRDRDGRNCDTGQDMDWDCRSECWDNARTFLWNEAIKALGKE